MLCLQCCQMWEVYIRSLLEIVFIITLVELCIAHIKLNVCEWRYSLQHVCDERLINERRRYFYFCYKIIKSTAMCECTNNGII